MTNSHSDNSNQVGPPHGHGHGEHGHGKPLRRLLRFLQPEKRDLWSVAIFALGIALLSLVVPIAVEELVNTIARGTYLQPLVFITIVMAACLSLAAALRVMQHIVVECLQQRLFVRVVSDLAYRLPRVRQEAFDNQDGPELVNRFFDVLTLQKAASVLLLDGLAVILAGLIGMVVLAFYHPFLLVFDFVLIICVAGIIFGLGINAIPTSIAESVAKYRVASWLEGLVMHPRAFKLSGGPELAWRQADHLARDYVLARRAHFRVLFRQIVFSLALQVAASVALLGLGGWLVINRQMTLGQLVAAELIVTMVVNSLIKLGKSLESYYDLMAAMEKLGMLVDLPLEPAGNEALAPTQIGRGASIRLRDASFQYIVGRRVLDKLSFSVRGGERVAIVGDSASGKSSLLELLFGMREPSVGVVEIDGVDIRELGPSSIRKNVALVQGNEIFDGTVLENIVLGRDHLNASDARRALEQVGLLEEILSLPHGLNSNMVNGGRTMSVGHGQLLMLARAIVGRPRLLLLDETLDTMDADVRWRLLPFLTDRSAPWTLFVVTRRPDVIELCDRAFELSRQQTGQPATLSERLHTKNTKIHTPAAEVRS